MGRRPVARSRSDHRLAALTPFRLALAVLASLFVVTASIAGTVTAGNFGRSPAFPTTPNGRFPQETAQIIQFKQAKVMRDADVAAGRPEKTPLEYRKLAAGGVTLSGLAMVALGETHAEQSQRLGVGAGVVGSVGGIMCATGYGCAIGGPLMAVGGVMYLGSVGMCIVADCSVKTTGDGTVDGTGITGNDVKATEKKSTSANTDFPAFDTYYWTISTDGLYVKYGVGKEFIVTASQGGYHTAMIVGYTGSGIAGMRSIFGDVLYTGGKIQPPGSVRDRDTLIPCSFGVEPCSRQFYQPSSSSITCAGYAACEVIITKVGSPGAAGQVLSQYVPVKEVPFLGLGSGSQLPPQSAAKLTSLDFMSAVANSVWKAQGATAPVPFEDNLKVTQEDVDAFRKAYPERASNLGDLARPISAPGQPPKIGPIDAPESPPQQVEVTNPKVDDGSTPTNTKEDEPDTELDNDEAGLLGDVMSPARDFLAGPFKKFMTPGIALPATECPVWTIDLPTLLGHSRESKPVSSAFLCDWFTQQRPLIVGILHLIYSLGALIVVFKRS